MNNVFTKFGVGIEAKFDKMYPCFLSVGDYHWYDRILNCFVTSPAHNVHNFTIKDGKWYSLWSETFITDTYWLNWLEKRYRKIPIGYIQTLLHLGIGTKYHTVSANATL